MSQIEMLLLLALIAVTAAEPCAVLFSPPNVEPDDRPITECRLRTLDADTANVSALSESNTHRLRIICSTVLLFESTLAAHSFARLHHLDELVIEDCKLLQLPASTFQGLRELKRLTIHSRNTEWGSGKALELHRDALDGLREVQLLDLADNNIRTIPVGTFCSLPSLQTLNLTQNRLVAVEPLGLGDCPGGSDLRALDLSGNRLVGLNGNGSFSRLRRLQRLLLQDNAIGEISSDALAGLGSLRVWNISGNRLERLPAGLFSSARDLREIYLQDNQLFQLAPGLFHNLEQLLVLDLSNNELSSDQIDGGTFVGLIRLIILNLSHNALTRLDARTFKDLFFLQILDLRNNSIGSIEDNSFLPLYNLHTLNLAENRIHHIGELMFNGLYVLNKLTINNNLIVSVDPKAFRNCSDLKELDLSSNAIEKVPQALQELSFLKTLDLGENRISTFQNGSFHKLEQLTGLRLIGNNIGNLTRGMFWELTNLQVLNLAKNKVQQIERGTFEHNKHLEAIRLDANFLTDIDGVFATLTSLVWLNLSDNHLVWFDYAFTPGTLKWLDIHGNYIEKLGNYYKIQEGLHIKTLDASHNRITDINPMSIPNSIELLFINNNYINLVAPKTFLEKHDLVRVDMYANELVKMDMNALRLSHVPNNRSLPEFYMGGNPFHCDCTMEWLQMINNMSQLRQYPRVMDLDNIVCRMTYPRTGTHITAVDAKPSNFLCTYETHCFALCHCCDFDACDCEMICPTNCSCYHDQTWTTNVVDCSGMTPNGIPDRIPMDVTELYLDGNNFSVLENHVFIGHKNMRVLYVNASHIQSIQNHTFNGLNNLEILHLEENRLDRLEGFEFEHLSHLRELYLHNNRIKFIDNVTLLPLHSLEILRLDGNRLVTFPVWQLTLNTRLTQLSLGNNYWSCKCKFLQELQIWVSDNAKKVLDVEDIYCYNNESKPPQRREIDLNDTACSDLYTGGSVIQSIIVSDYLPMVIITLSAFVIILAITIILFVFREPMRIWVYSRYGIRLFQFKGAAAKHYVEDREKLFDGYVCYSPKDEEFVLGSIVAELEHGNPSFQLCLHYRDLPQQGYLQQTSPVVLEAAEASRRVILVLSRNFLQTEWSRYEFRSALHEALKGRIFKLVVVEQGSCPPEAEMDPDLRPYLKTGARVRWGEKRFWERLRYAMPNSEHSHKSSMYRRNINTYSMDSGVVVMGNGGALQTKRPASPYKTTTTGGEPPATAPPYTALPTAKAINTQHHYDEDTANYSSATTATPSPRPRNRQQHPQQPPYMEQRPISEHIYSSIDSEYGPPEMDHVGTARRHPVPVHLPPQWRHNNGGQAYLV